MAVALEPAFIDGQQGRLLVVCYRPSAENGQALIVVPPFAEEANRARRMFSLQARQLAEAGYTVLLPDLFGTGDSEGDFADATWSFWQSDLDAVFSWAASMELDDLSVLALRSGVLLAADYLAQRQCALKKLVCWHPCTNGSLYLRQFLRLRLVADMLGSGDKKETANTLLEQLQQGESLEVAGYMLNPALVLPMADINLETSYPQNVVPVRWFEVVPESQTALSVPGKKSVAAWQSQGFDVSESIVAESQFWATQEITTAPRLLNETSRWLKTDHA